VFLTTAPWRIPWLACYVNFPLQKSRAEVAALTTRIEEMLYGQMRNIRHLTINFEAWFEMKRMFRQIGTVQLPLDTLTIATRALGVTLLPFLQLKCDTSSIKDNFL
jgi:hypothetical protein